MMSFISQVILIVSTLAILLISNCTCLMEIRNLPGFVFERNLARDQSTACLPVHRSVCHMVKNLGQCQFKYQSKRQNECYKNVNLITLADSLQPILSPFFSCVTLGSCNYTICIYCCPLLGCNEV